jgi:hypothetical protein
MGYQRLPFFTPNYRKVLVSAYYYAFAYISLFRKHS